MLFNSFEFGVFLVIVFALYWMLNKKLTVQNILLLGASYVFYGWWDYRFLFLLIFSTFLDYFTGLKIADARSIAWKKRWLTISITVNLGFLAVFKYYNFFVQSFADLLQHFGMRPSVTLLEIVLPVGISFYTFHGLSYVIDIYKDRIEPTRNFTNYSVFVAFFPLLVAGPIERATHLLPQVAKPRVFDYNKAVDGLRQMLWGFFKKVVIADNAAGIVDNIFGHYTQHSGATLLMGAFLFTFQIYCDFSGYSDIALGTARLFGFELLRNFSYPYFSRDIAEFWRRWHISLSTWFRDYLYYPLGGSRGTLAKTIRNTIIIFVVSGFWHGANWTFIVWGALNAFYFIPLLVAGKNRTHIGVVAEDGKLPTLREFAGILVTFVLTVFAWIFFRAPDLTTAFRYIGRLLSASLFRLPDVRPYITLFFIFVLLAFEWYNRRNANGLDLSRVKYRAVRWSIYILLLIAILGKGQFNKTSFIYFQF